MTPVAALAVLAAVLQVQGLAGAQVGADQVSGSTAVTSTSTEQVETSVRSATGADGPLAGTSGTVRPARALGATEQVGSRARALGPAGQITVTGRTASAPPALSTRQDGHVVSVVTVHGHDRCDPVKGDATHEECAAILDYRADQFAKPAAPDLTPEDALIQSPPSTNLTADATAARRLSGPEGADPSVAAAAAAVEGSPEGAQAAAVGATDRVAPAAPLGALPATPAPTSSNPTVTVTGPR